MAAEMNAFCANSEPNRSSAPRHASGHTFEAALGTQFFKGGWGCPALCLSFVSPTFSFAAFTLLAFKIRLRLLSVLRTFWFFPVFPRSFRFFLVPRRVVRPPR